MGSKEVNDVAVIKQLAPKLVGSLTDDTINELISNAHLIAVSDKFPEDIQMDGISIVDLATRYMTLHLASIQGKTGQGVISEKVDVLEKHYADTTNLGWFKLSPWGQLYRHLYLLYAGGNNPRIAVIQH